MLWRIHRVNILSIHKRKLCTEIHVEFAKRAPLKLKFGKLAKLADGSCVGSSGSTSVLSTCVGATNGTSQGFVPLTVDYRQKAAAAGRIPTNFLRRELGPSEKEILTARVIDRSLRPLFPKGYSSEVQVVANLLAIDGSNLPDVVALNTASASLAFSNIPWNGPIGAVRVGYTPEAGFVINPTRQELINSSLNLMLTGTRFNQAVMLEAEAANFDHVLFAEAIQYGLEHCTQIAKAIHTEAIKHGKAKRKIPQEKLEEKVKIRNELEALCMSKIRGIFMDFSHDKFSRDKATKKLAHQAINEISNGAPQEPYYEVFGQICQSVIIEMGIHSKLRVDGRQLDQLRNINCEVNMHEPLHGSALFQRGQTQVMCTVALDSLDSALKTDTISALLGGVKEKNFFLHYEFPPYATNEVGRMTGSGGRRELGHGALAEKALKAILPTNWPFTIRLTSEVLESNGSSSMASVCGGSLALLDSGVPITEPAAGVAIGLLTYDNQNTDGEFQVGQYQVLTDILGMEDYFGDMDFKVAGTRSGITALQADIKIPGLPFGIIQEALQKGQKGINQILDIMEDCISEPAKGKSNWPITEIMHVPITKRGKFVGPGGANLRKILTETGVQINQSPEDVSKFNIFAPNAEAMSEAKEIMKKVLIEERIPDFEFGAAYQVTITEILDRGILVQLHPEMKPIMIPNSQLDARKIADARVLGYKEGQTILVKYYGNDPASGQVRLSRKVLTIAAASAVKNLRSAKKEHVTEPKSTQGFVDYKRKSSSSNVQHRLGSNLLESIYEKPKEEVMESEVIQKESILPQNEQKQLRERDQQQKQVTTDASEVKVDVESDPKIDKFLAYIAQGKANGDTFCQALSDRLENCNQLLSWQKSKVFRADLTEDIKRAEKAAIKGLAIYLSQKYLSQALNEDLEAMCSRYAIQMNEHPFMEAMKSKLINLNQAFNDRNVFDVKKFEPSEWFNLYRELQSYPLDCIDSVSLNDWREFESLALLSFQLSDSVVNKLVTSQQTEANQILLFKTILEHPNEDLKQHMLPPFQKASNVLFFKDQLNEYERLESERMQRLKSWSSDEDIKKEQMKIYQTITVNKNLLKFYDHVQWHLNDQTKVKQVRKETEEQIRTQIEMGLEEHKSELLNVEKKAKVLWKKLLAGETSL